MLTECLLQSAFRKSVRIKKKMELPVIHLLTYKSEKSEESFFNLKDKGFMETAYSVYVLTRYSIEK
ncbi:hypothetical protein X777_16403 [Ooceraea biroi]|uniref:Uncharacterized protein n=1 Tax=Ooceraea biroi TaxID=2015173 RepID=A0A026WX40_OOCBI|nr:hypothetical protein X777_16403 [Ooceraea biroi]